MFFSGQVSLQHKIDNASKAIIENLYTSSKQNYPLNIGDGWSDQNKIGALILLVSYCFTFEKLLI